LSYQINRIVIVSLFQAIENLRVQVGKLKNMYGSGITVLDSLAEELKGNNQLNFGELNSEVAKHSSALEDVSV